MAKPRVDYDRLAPEYDLRYAPGNAMGIEQALLGLVQRLQARRVLEAGCGTGHWLAALQAAAPQVCGLDPSAGMLREARRQERPVGLLRGVAEHLPLAPGALDVVFCVHALHHFDDLQAFIREAGRVLGPGGTLAVVGTDPRGRPESWYGFHYFAGAYETDLRRVPAWATVRGWMAEVGFEEVGLQEVDRVVEAFTGRAVLGDPFLRKGASSQTALLSDEVYQAGLKEIEADVAQAEARGETIVFHTDIQVDMLSGRKRG